MYIVIQASKYNNLKLEQAKLGFDIVKCTQYTDGTVKVRLDEIVKHEETWEETRQKYLRDAKSDGKKAFEGESSGHFVTTQDDTEVLYWVNAYNDEYMDEDYYWPSFYEWTGEVFKQNYIPHYESEPNYFENLDEYEPNQVDEDPKEIEDWINIAEAYRQEDDNSLDAIQLLERDYYKGKSLDKIITSMIKHRFCNSHNFDNLNEPEKRDFVGHLFGLYHTKALQISDKKRMRVIIKDKIGALIYVEEHYSRNIVETNVALELIRRFGYCNQNDYTNLNNQEKRDFLFQLFEQKFKKMLGEVVSDKKLAVKLMENNFVYDVVEMFNCQLLNPKTKEPFKTHLSQFERHEVESFLDEI